MRVLHAAGDGIPSQRRVGAEQSGKRRGVVDRHRHVERTGGGEPHEDCHVHARQRVGRRRRLHLEANAGQSADGTT